MIKSMATGGRVAGCSGSNFSALLQNQRGPCATSQPLDPFFLTGSSSSFLGALFYLFALRFVLCLLCAIIAA